jgi:glycosyltransferase involved in cell wall biosynthesis
MRALLITEATATGVGRHVCDLAQGLSKRGHTVNLVYSRLRADNTFLQRVERANYVSSELPMHHSPSPRDIRAITAIRNYIRRHGPFDVIHGHSTKAGLLARLAAIGSDAAVVYTPHALATMDTTRNALHRTALRRYEALLSSLTNVIIAVSEEEREHAISIGIAPHRLIQIPNGLASARGDRSVRTTLRREWQVRDTDVCIGCVGRLTRQKAFDVALSAFSAVLRKCPNAVLAIVGDGPLKPFLIKRATRAGIDHAVRWCGAVDGAEAMSAFDISLLTSEYEGFPYALLEALAAGLPIVTTDVGGSRALVEHGLNGFTARRRDSTAIANFLTELATNCDLRAEFGARSAERAKLFPIERMIDATIAAYETAVTFAAFSRNVPRSLTV